MVGGTENDKDWVKKGRVIKGKEWKRMEKGEKKKVKDKKKGMEKDKKRGK